MKRWFIWILLGSMLVLFGLATTLQARGNAYGQPDSERDKFSRQELEKPALPTVLQNGADFTVNIPDDPGNPTCLPADCSLRAAITAANANSLTETQTIDFDLIYPVTITLSSSLPMITGTVVISGAGSENLTVSGDHLYRVFEIGNSASLAMSGIAIRNGFKSDGGSGIFNDHGTLSLSDCVLAENSSVDFLGGAGLLNDFGTVEIRACLFSDNSAGTGEGGGLRNNDGLVTITGTTFANNQAFHNGAIHNSGTMTVTDSLIADNTARVGAGIYNSGVLTVTNSTFSGNIAYIASGGALDNGGTLVVANSTFYENGADRGADIDNMTGSVHITNSTIYSTTSPSSNSIYNGGLSATLTLSNTILAAPAGIENCSNTAGGSLLVSADNLATDGTCTGATVVTPDQLMLGPLQDNGGNTPTIALMLYSVAINAGNDAACAAPVGSSTYGAGGLDQRGVIRPQGEHCDVGAFEQAFLQAIFLPIIYNSP